MAHPVDVGAAYPNNLHSVERSMDSYGLFLQHFVGLVEFLSPANYLHCVVVVKRKLFIFNVDLSFFPCLPQNSLFSEELKEIHNDGSWWGFIHRCPS